MLHNLRREDRYPIAGEAWLSAGGFTVAGEVVDISLNGIALRVDEDGAQRLDGRKTWRCRVESRDLPATVDFLVCVVRQRAWLGGLGLGCMITAIDERPLVFLRAYRTLAVARANPPVWRRRPAGEG